MGAWGGYANGKIPKSALVQIQGNIYAAPQTAAAYRRIAPLFKQTFGTDLHVNSAYRDLAAQQDLVDHPSKAWGPVAPAGSSNHGWGTAIDFGNNISDKNSTTYKWMSQYAPLYGLTNTGAAFGEPGHWETVGGTPGSTNELQGKDVESKPVSGPLVDWTQSLTTVLGNLGDGAFWQRAGLMTLGGVLLLIVVIKLTATTEIGSAAISAGTTALKAAPIGKVIPK